MTELEGPRQIILVSCRYKGKDNVMTAAWHMPTSFVPRLYAISIGKKRFSHDMIKKSRLFCVNFIPKELEKLAIKCGSLSGRNVDKFAVLNIKKARCKKINCPRIRTALGWLECKVVKIIETGDHTIFVGKVVYSKLAKKGKRGKRLFYCANKFTTTLE